MATTTRAVRACPGCGLVMPLDEGAVYDGYFYTSPECWSVFTEVLAAEYSDAVLFGQVHQCTVDAYAVQHAGGSHPDKSVGVHLCGLYFVLKHGVKPPDVPPLLQRLVRTIDVWPHIEPPASADDPITVLDVALAGSLTEHVDRVRAWAEHVWAAWALHHDAVADLVQSHLD